MLQGMLLDKYCIVKRIGGGAFGDVYLCDEQMNGNILRRAAVKVIKTEAMNPAEVKDQFNDCTFPAFILDRSTEFEAKKHIVQIYDWGFQEIEGAEKAIIAMEYIQKPRPLGSIISRNISIGNYPREEEVVEYLRQILSGLSVAHKLKILHRDLHPGNILISDGNVKLVDFGLALKINSKYGIIGEGGGSILYSAPENFGEYCLLASDIYSVGLSMYEFWTNYHPFRELELRLEHSEKENEFNRYKSREQWYYQKGKEVDKRVCGSHGLDGFFKKCLSADLKVRYASAMEALEDLNKNVINLGVNLTENAAELLKNGDCQKAAAVFMDAKREHKRKDAQLGDIYINLAKCHMGMGDYNEAVKWLLETEKTDNEIGIYFAKDDKRLEYLSILADCYKELGYTSMAMIYDKKAQNYRS